MGQNDPSIAAHVYYSKYLKKNFLWLLSEIYVHSLHDDQKINFLFFIFLEKLVFLQIPRECITWIILTRRKLA